MERNASTAVGRLRDEDVRRGPPKRPHIKAKPPTRVGAPRPAGVSPAGVVSARPEWLNDAAWRFSWESMTIACIRHESDASGRPPGAVRRTGYRVATDAFEVLS